MSHPVNWFQIQGPNAHALQQFYKQVFGWKMTSMPGMPESAMVAAEPKGIPGGIGTAHSHQPRVTVYVSVGDIDALFGKIQRGGGRMSMSKMDLPGGMGSVAEFTDPAGNTIGLWMAGKPAAPKRKASAKKASAKKTAKKAPPKKAPKKAAAKKAPAKKPAKTKK